MGSGIYINGVESELPTWRLNGTTAIYGTSTDTQITINGVKSLDGISLSGNTVTNSDSALNQGTVTISNGYELALAEDVSRPTNTAADWSFENNIATYKAESTSASYTLANNQITYADASGGESFTVNGVISSAGLSLNGNVVTVANSALNQGMVTISDNNYTLALANDVRRSELTAGSWRLEGDISTCRTDTTTAGYKLENNQISYVEAGGGDTFTVNGVRSLDGLSINGNIITIGATALNQKNITISNIGILAAMLQLTRRLQHGLVTRLSITKLFTQQLVAAIR